MTNMGSDSAEQRKENFTNMVKSCEILDKIEVKPKYVVHKKKNSAITLLY